jgi:hypothetical protein
MLVSAGQRHWLLENLRFRPGEALIFCRLATAKRRPRILRVLRDLRVEKQIAQKNTEITKEKLFGTAKLLLSRYCRSR